MPHPPDYVALTRGQLAVLDRINAGAAGVAVLDEVVRLARQVLGGAGAGFAEYGPGHGRIIAACGTCACALGRRVHRADAELERHRSMLITLTALSDEFARPPGDDAENCRVLAARADAAGAIVGALYVYFSADAEPPGPEQQAVLELLATLAGRLYTHPNGLPAYGDDTDPAELARRQEDRDLFVAVTSHELRTPVTVIKGYADTMTNHWDSLDECGRQEAARVIGVRAGELSRLVDRLLAATSEDTDVSGSPPGPFDLVEALRQAAAELPADLRRRIVLDDLPAELPKAYGDRATLATILTELATNADKYSPANTPVEVRAEADEQTVTFRVCDRGVGIAPEHVERAFERYWQGDSGDRRRPPGAGLGLYLVRRIVERQRGWVALRPREGGGTLAEVRLPRS
ncbi:sensor histidine kinase [Krasilnikovia sp. MM14-A1259]|uniref:sensor histidine kinase n=1 Tax=Krasilnikovia sp. MM14-A1259 TaxID=3373539 RepID=UPI00380D0D73